MKTFNLTQIVTFQTGVANNKGMLIDRLLLDIIKNNTTAYPF
jgi:hypothetical protein